MTDYEKHLKETFATSNYKLLRYLAIFGRTIVKEIIALAFGRKSFLQVEISFTSFACESWS